MSQRDKMLVDDVFCFFSLNSVEMAYFMLFLRNFSLLSIESLKAENHSRLYINALHKHCLHLFFQKLQGFGSGLFAFGDDSLKYFFG